MARNNQISRIYNILLILEYAPHGISVRGLCDRLNERGHPAVVRTVYRDLMALRHAGFPLNEKGTNADNAKRWVLERKTQITKALPLTHEETILLQKIYGVLREQTAPDLQQVAAGLVGKIAGQLGAGKKFHVAC